jgi:hypothetical protein
MGIISNQLTSRGASPGKLGTATYFAKAAYEIRIGGGKSQSKAQGGKSKNPFFQIFFYLFPYKYLRIYAIRKTRVFRSIRASSPY